MQLAKHLAEDIPTESQLHEDGMTVDYWRVFRQGSMEHFELVLTLWISGHRLVEHLQLFAYTTLTLALDGRMITLEAAHDAIGIALGENGDHLGPIRVIDHDADGANGRA